MGRLSQSMVLNHPAKARTEAIEGKESISIVSQDLIGAFVKMGHRSLVSRGKKETVCTE
jgi:hypothetical protein